MKGGDGERFGVFGLDHFFFFWYEGENGDEGL